MFSDNGYINKKQQINMNKWLIVGSILSLCFMIGLASASNPISNIFITITTNDTNYNYNTGYTFHVFGTGGGNGGWMIVTWYIDGHVLMNTEWTTATGFDGGGSSNSSVISGLTTGIHTVQVEVWDALTGCSEPIDYESPYRCENSFTHYLGFTVLAKSGSTSINSPSLTYYSNRIPATKDGFRTNGFTFLTGAIAGGTAPYNVNIRAFDGTGLIPLVNCNNTIEGGYCNGSVSGYVFPDVSYTKIYSIQLSILDSTGRSKLLGNYFLGSDATYPLTIYSNMTATSSGSNNPFIGSNYTNTKIEALNILDEYKIKYHIAEGTPPFNVTIGFYNETSPYKLIPLCSWYNFYNYSYELTMIPRGNNAIRLDSIVYDDYQCNITPDSCGSVRRSVSDSKQYFDASTSTSYLRNTSNYYVNCHDVGGVIGYPYNSNGGLNSSNIQTIMPYNVTDTLKVEIGSIDWCDGLFDSNGICIPLPSGGVPITTPLGDEILGISTLWILIGATIGIGGYLEYKAKSGGIVFLVIIVVGLAIGSYLEILPLWIPIVVGIGGILIFASFLRNKIKGG